MNNKIKLRSAKQFLREDGVYEFPFVCMDTTPGGSNLGRIEWHIEPIRGRKHRGRYYIEKLLVYASQTRNKKYRGIVFEISCYSESLYSSILHPEDEFIPRVWRIMFCEEHKTPVLSAYPENRHTRLEINVGSSIMINTKFL